MHNLSVSGYEVAFKVGLPLHIPGSQKRAPGLHCSDIYNAIAQDYYKKWFAEYADDRDPERLAREIEVFAKGHIHEAMWGNAMADMLPLFERPEPRVLDGVSCSADGYTPLMWATTTPDEMYAIARDWPDDYPQIMLPAIHECKMTAKSCNRETSPLIIEATKQFNEKFCTWYWQVASYCHVWECRHAYIYALHTSGEYDYKKRPWVSIHNVTRVDFTTEQLKAHWAWMLNEADTRNLWEIARIRDKKDGIVPDVTYWEKAHTARAYRMAARG